MLLIKKDLVSFIIGMCLGDSNMRLGKNAVNYNLICTHNPNQYDYMIWKMDILKENLEKNYWVNKINTKFSGKGINDGNKNKTYEMYKAVFGTHTLITSIYKRMYIENKKYVPEEILNNLTPIGLAIWYMDDGNLAYQKDRNYPNIIAGRNVTLHIQGFNNESQINIVNYFKDTWNIETRLHKARDKYKLWMNTKNSIEFLKIVAPYVNLVECMKYKIDLKYKTKNINILPSVEPAF
jgi:recombination protein RecA